MALANLFGGMKAEDKPATAACGTACGARRKARRETSSMWNQHAEQEEK